MFDTEPLYYQVGTELLARRGHTFTPELQQQMMGRPGIEAITVMIDACGLTDAGQDLLDESDVIYATLLEQQLQPMPGLFDFLDHLQRCHIRFGVATSSKRVFAERILSRFDLLQSLEFLLTGEDVQLGKPNPEMYLTAARRFDVPPKNMLVLEDSRHGSAAGVAAGACTVAIPGQHNGYQQYPDVAFTARTLIDAELLSRLQPVD